MKTCKSCKKKKARSFYSNNQWNKPDENQRCIDCIQIECHGGKGGKRKHRHLHQYQHQHPPPDMILAPDEFESIRSHYETINQCHVDPMTWSHLKDVEISQETEAAFKRSCNYYYGADASMYEEELQDDYDFGVTQYQDHSLLGGGRKKRRVDGLEGLGQQLVKRFLEEEKRRELYEDLGVFNEEELREHDDDDECWAVDNEYAIALLTCKGQSLNDRTVQLTLESYLHGKHGNARPRKRLQVTDERANQTMRPFPMPVCSYCNRAKIEEEFYGLSSLCRECHQNLTKKQKPRHYKRAVRREKECREKVKEVKQSIYPTTDQARPTIHHNSSDVDIERNAGKESSSFLALAFPIIAAIAIGYRLSSSQE